MRTIFTGGLARPWRWTELPAGRSVHARFARLMYVEGRRTSGGLNRKYMTDQPEAPSSSAGNGVQRIKLANAFSFESFGSESPKRGGAGYWEVIQCPHKLIELLGETVSGTSQRLQGASSENSISWTAW